MKPLVLYPMSALAGAGVLALVLLGTGIAAPQVSTQALHTTQRMFIENVQDINSWPNPRDMVVIRQGTPYIVPPGRLLVVTALGANSPSLSGQTELQVDGVFEVTAPAGIGSSGEASSMKLLPLPGFVVQSGSTVNLDGGGGANNPRRAWGYLVDA